MVVEPDRPILLQTNACGFIGAGKLNPYVSFRIRKLVNFNSPHCSSAKQNSDMYDQDILPIVETLQQWHHHLEARNHKILI
jgi:hypothetical protein